MPIGRSRGGPPPRAGFHRPTQPKRDPGAYIGRLPERATETIPGGLGPKDERVSAVATQPAPARGPAPATERGAPPEGHREASQDRNDTRREAGERH